MNNLTRKPKLLGACSGDASSPQCGCDAPVAFFQTQGKMTRPPATMASPAHFCDGASQPHAGQLRLSGLIKPFAVALLAAALPCEDLFAQKAAVGQAWPSAIPCRIQDGMNPDLFVMTLGEVQTPIADGVFDPVKDEVVLKDGTVKTNYYRDVLGVKFYQPNPIFRNHRPAGAHGITTTIESLPRRYSATRNGSPPT